ncbi:MAG TPA: S53 family peptidase [Chloroflexota bacterium]|nr:S53 family peptidase [Chloroflexota bacterium]
MRDTPLRRVVSVLSSLALASSAVFGAGAVASLAASPSHGATLRGQAVIRGEVAPPILNHAARLIGARNPASRMGVSVALPLRHPAELDRLINRIELGQARPISQAQFDARYGQPAARVVAVTRWAASYGLHVIYHSPDGLDVSLDGTTQAFDRALRIRVNDYRLGSRRFFAAASNPWVPAKLHIMTIVGLNSLIHGYALGLHRRSFPAGGYTPKELRAAYDVSQHAGSGAGQTIGFTLWGSPTPAADFNKFSTVTGDAHITQCAATTTVPTPAACQGTHAANTIQWVQLDGKSNDLRGNDETAMDVEEAHGIAPNSHLKYFLGDDGSGQGLVDVIAAAANDTDKTLHAVSNSWGACGPGPGAGGCTSLVNAQTSEFKHAVATGRTFFFSSGDSAAFSGCPRHGTELQVTCNGTPEPSWPADSPLVVAVGGTNLQMNSSFTAYSSESVWSNLQFGNSSAYSVSGGGSGCASFFGRPLFQQGVAGVTANATCAGRAEPDVAADADASSGVLEIATSTNQNNQNPKQVQFVDGGTSLAAPLWTGMSADTNNFLLAHHRALQGFWAPEIYKLAQTARYDSYFHDVVCGFNGSPASLGWDQATGWGSPDWFNLTEGIAGIAVGAKPAPSNCQIPASEAVATAEASLKLPFKFWPPGTEASTERVRSAGDSIFDDATCDQTSCNNFFRQFHGHSYASFGFKGGAEEQAVFTIGGDSSSPFAFFAGSYYPNSLDAHRVIEDAVAHANSAFHIGSFDCSVNLEGVSTLTPDCKAMQFQFPGPPVVDATIYLFAVNNTVGELIVEANDSTVSASQSNTNTYLADSDHLAGFEIAQLYVASNATSVVYPAPSLRHRALGPLKFDAVPSLRLSEGPARDLPTPSSISR